MTRVVNKRKENFDTYIGRGSPFGNPYSHIKDKETKAEFIVETREESISKFREYFYKKLVENVIFRRSVENLKGKTLGCFCAPQSCHGDVIKEYLDNDFKILYVMTHIVDDDGKPCQDWLTPEEYAERLAFSQMVKECLHATAEASRRQLEQAGLLPKKEL